MKLWILWGAVFGVVLIGGFVAFNASVEEEQETPAATDHKYATYILDGKSVPLVDGTADADGVRTRYFGNEVTVDANADGRDDVVFLLTQETTGSGTFFYVVAALNTERGYVGSTGLLLGDRIAPQTTEVSTNPNHKGVVVVNYADRAPGEPMSTKPSVGKSVWLKLDPQSLQFGEVAQGFEGEADPSRMSLGMKSWVWVASHYRDGRVSVPAQPERFKLTFEQMGRLTATTDCNGVGGTYVAGAGTLRFSQLLSTLMYCEGSQETEFVRMLEEVRGYHFTTRGELILTLASDAGTVTFK